jgi:small redox-active disulfide protein 2
MATSRVIIEGTSVGIVDLEDIFAHVRDAKIPDAEQVKDLILNKVKVKNYIPARMERLYREDLYEEYLVFTGALPARRPCRTVVEVRLYGAGCFRCEKIDAMVKQVLSRNGLRVDYQYITDLNSISRSGIMVTPALVVGGSVLLAGRVPTEKQLETMLLDAITTKA